jgi:putative FmdB family regulatory protein
VIPAKPAKAEILVQRLVTFRSHAGRTILLGISWEAPLPVYDYICLDCHKPFETVLTLSEHDKENPKCPHCGSKNVDQEAAAFFAVTSRKS